MSPGRTSVSKEIQNLVAETGDILLQFLEETDCCELNVIMSLQKEINESPAVLLKENK